MQTELFDQLLAEHAATNTFSGVVLVQQAGAAGVRFACGEAVRGWHVPNTPSTRFRVASLSKMWTAVATLQCVEQGLFSLESSVVEQLDLRDTTIPEAVHVHHLLAMTAGIADWFDESEDWAQVWANLSRTYPIYLLRSNADYLPLFAHQPPRTAAGEAHSYNNAAYILLGLLIEKARGLSYFDAMHQHVLRPAGMVDSGFWSLEDVVPNIADGYIPPDDPDGVWRRNSYAVTPWPAADGGATSTADDLLRFARALRDGMLLSSEYTTALLTPQAFDGSFRGYDWWYGYGVGILRSTDGQIVRWGHTGEEDGVSCRQFYYPQHDIDVVILGNYSGCAGTLGWEIHDLIVAAR